MADRHLPVRPNLDQLKHQAKDLLRAIRRGDPEALAELRKHHPEQIDPARAKLADAQLALARSYGLPSWPRLVLACRMTDAIWRDDVDAVRDAGVAASASCCTRTRAASKGNWGPPMSYAANLGRDRHHRDAARARRGRRAVRVRPRVPPGPARHRAAAARDGRAAARRVR